MHGDGPHEIASPADLTVYKGVIEEESTEDEDRTVEILELWLIDDGSQDQV